MAKSKLTKEHKRAILNARRRITVIHDKDANEMTTRHRVASVFQSVMGYKPAHLSHERAVYGAGGRVYVDIAIQTEPDEDATPQVMVEIKRVGLELARKHLKQVCGYAIDAGCDWVLLTNGREWRVYHVEFEKPPEIELVEQWDLLRDEPHVLAAKFELLSLKSVKHGSLDTLWDEHRALVPRRLLKAILSPKLVKALRLALKKDTSTAVPEDRIVNGIRKMLNERAASALDDVLGSMPAPKPKPQKPRAHSGSRCKLKDLITADLIRPETTLFVEYKGKVHEATVQADGTILFEGKTFKTPSAAGGAVTAKHGVHAPNGWWFWQLSAPDGSPKPLETIRQEYSDKAQPASGVQNAEQSTVG